MNNVICAAETGCGKTLAYLLPIIQRLLMYKPTIDNSDSSSPLAVILLPSQELAEQVSVCIITHYIIILVRSQK